MYETCFTASISIKWGSILKTLEIRFRTSNTDILSTKQLLRQYYETKYSNYQCTLSSTISFTN